MRKGIAIAGVAAGIAVVGGIGFTQWAKGRAVATIEGTIAAARAAGYAIEHGPIQVDVWSRTLRIDDVKLGLPGEAMKTATIARIRADGIGLFSRDFIAARIDASGIDIQHRVAVMPEIAVAAKASTLVATNVVLPSAPLILPATADAGTMAGTYIEQMRADALHVERIDASMKMPPALFAPPPGSRIPPPRSLDEPITYSYGDIKLERIGGGRIAKTSVARMTFGGPTGAGTIDGMSVADIDMLPFFRVGLDRRKAIDGYYPVQGAITVGAMSIKVPDGGNVVMGGVTASGFAIDPNKVSFQTLGELFVDVPKRPTPGADTVMLDRMARLYEGMRVDDMTMRGMQISGGAIPAGNGIRIGAITLQGLVGGKLKVLRVNDLDVAVPQTPGRPGQAQPTSFKMGSAALLGFDIVRTMRFASLASQPGRLGAPPAPSEALAMFEGFEMQSTKIPDFGSGEFDIQDMRLGWGVFANGVPGALRMQFKGRMPINPRDPNMAALRALGMTSLEADYDIASRFEPDRQMITADVTRFRVEKIGALSGQLQLGNVTPRAYAMIPSLFAVVSPQFTLRTLDLKLVDAGAIQAFYAPAFANLPPAAGPVAQLKRTLIDPGQPGGNLGAVLDSLDRFLAAPAQTLAIKLTSNEPVRLGDFTDSANFVTPGPLARLLERFAVDARVTK